MQQPSPQTGEQSTGQVHADSGGMQQPSMQAGLVPQSTGQVQGVSPTSQVPSPQPLQGGPQVCVGGQAQSEQFVQSSPGSQVVLPQ